MSWGADVLQVTEETFQMIKAATSGITSSTNLFGVDLQPLVSLVPVDTPFFNSTPRVSAKMGSQFAMWQALLNVNSSQSDVGLQSDFAAPLVQIQNQWVYAPFVDLGMGGTVTQDAIAQAQGYADALAVATLQTINQVLIGMDIHQLCAQSFALPTIGTVTLAASQTGGSIAASTAVHVVCAARSGVNYYRGGSGATSSDATLTTASVTSTNSVTATVPAVKGAVAYDWYVGTTTGNRVYTTTTTVNTVVLTAIFTAAQVVPSLPLIFNAGVAGPSGASVTADSSFQTYWENGLLASIVGDFSGSPDQLGNSMTANLVTPGSGTSQGAYFKSLDGATLTHQGAAIAEIDAMFQTIYNSFQLSPTRLLMAAQSINDIANGLLNNPQAVTWLIPTDADGRRQIVAGGAVAKYLNKTVNGKPVIIELQPHLPPGTIIAVTDEVPFPGANIDTVLSVETQFDFWRFDYGANRVAASASGGPRYDFEVRSRQAFRNRAGSTMGIISNIAAGIG